MTRDNNNREQDPIPPFNGEVAQEIIAALGQGVTIVDADGHFEYVNPAYARMVGRSPQALLGLSPADVTHPDDRSVLLRARRQRQAGETTTYQTRLQKPNGDIVHAHITGVPRRQEGKVSGALTIITDITAHKQVEEAYQTLVENSLQGLLIIQDFRIVFANNQVEQISGYSPEELRAFSPEQFISRIYDADRETVQKRLATHLAGENAPPRMEFRIRHKNGELRWVEVHTRHITYQNKPAAQVAYLDITERKTAEQVLQVSEEKHRRLLNSIRSPVVALTNEMNVLYCNQAYAEFVGLPLAKLEGQHLLSLFPEFSQTKSYAAYQKALETGEMQKVEGKMRRWHWQVRVHPTPWGILAIADDVTGRKQAEEALRRSERRAQRQAQELALLDRVRTALARELDLTTVVRTVVEAITATFGYALVSLYLLRGEWLILQHQVGYTHVIQEIPITEGISGRVVNSGEPVLLEDIRADPDFLGAGEGIVSEVCVPLFDQDEVAGILNVESTQGRVLTEDDLQLMTALSKDVNIAIYRARLYAEVQQSRKQLQTVITNAPIILWALDKEGVFTHSTGKGLESLALGPGELVGRSLFETFGSKIPALSQIFQRAVTGKETETTVEIGDKIFATRYSPLHNEAGEVSGVTGVALDVTAQAEAEASLRASEAQYRLVVNSVGDVIFQTDTAGAWTFLNRAWTETTGFAVGKSLGNKFLDYVHPEDRQKNTAEFQSLIEKRKNFCRHEVRYLTTTGGHRWLEVHARRIENEAGETLGASGLLRDVTERKQRERELESFTTVTRALRQANTRDQMLPIILDQALDLLQAGGAMFITHPDQNTKQVELARGDWQLLSGLGLSPEESVAGFETDEGDIYISDDVRAGLSPTQASLLAPHNAVMGAPVTREGEVAGVIWVGRPQPFSTVEAQSLKAIVEITAAALERARLLETLEHRVVKRTQELVAAHERLKELDQLKTKFIDDVSHELRTPATSINLYLDLLARGQEDRREVYLTELREISHRLTQIIGSILQFSLLTETVVTHNPTVVDLNEITAGVVDKYRPIALEKGLDLSFMPDTDLPSVWGIAGLFSQAIDYLLDNAIKYTAKGSVEIRTYLDEDQQLACVQISDTGIGIEPDELAHVFDRFYRGREVGQLTTPGVGLGLSLAREIAGQYGGRIELDSRPDQGTTVRLGLPFVG